MVLTTYDIKGTYGKEWKDVKWTTVTFLLQQVGQNTGLLIEYDEEVSQNPEVERRRKQLPPGVPFCTVAEN